MTKHSYILNNLPDIKKRYPNYDARVIKYILETTNKLIADKILMGEEFIMPYNMGMICVAKLKQRRMFDYIHWCKTSEKIEEYNLHTLGYIFKTLWISGNNYFKKKELTNKIYKFTPNRWYFKRPLAKLIQSGYDNYQTREYIESFFSKSKIRI